MITYRVAGLTDIPALCELLTELFSQETEFTPDSDRQAKALGQIIGDRKVGEVFVAEYDNKVIGMVSLLYTISTALGSKVAMLEDMIITKASHRGGAGSGLIRYALDHAKKDGCARVTLLTDADNTIAQNFYVKQGFDRSTMVPYRKIMEA